MILHTTIPQEIIFGMDGSSDTQKEKMVLYQGVPVMVEPINESDFRITKIVSTDPNHFLQSQCYPGAIISMWDS